MNCPHKNGKLCRKVPTGFKACTTLCPLKPLKMLPKGVKK